MFAGALGRAAVGLGGGGGRGLLLPLESMAKSMSRAKRTSDFEQRKGVGGVLGGFEGGAFAVEGAVVVPEDEGWEL